MFYHGAKTFPQCRTATGFADQRLGQSRSTALPSTPRGAAAEPLSAGKWAYRIRDVEEGLDGHRFDAAEGEGIRAHLIHVTPKVVSSN